jgi:hypothetical protein
MDVQLSRDVAEAGKLFSGVAKRSSFHERKKCAIQSTEISSHQSRLATTRTIYFSVLKLSIQPTMHLCVRYHFHYTPAGLSDEMKEFCDRYELNS